MKLRLLLLVLVCGALLCATGDAYRAEIEQWQQHREASLKADGGWLTVTGLFWLHDGDNTFGPAASNEIVLPEEPALHGGGIFELHKGKISMRLNGQTRELKADSAGRPDIVTLGSLTMFVIQRGDRYGIRLKDQNSRLRKEFTGLHYFPVKEAYRITAHFVADAKKVPIPNILGQTEDVPSPGYVEFQMDGQHLRLTPVQESPDELSYIFRDLTAGKETYGSGRFLESGLPKNGEVVLDFNKAYNPPCAFTPFATCPLPPKQNRLPVRIEAGELKYGSH